MSYYKIKIGTYTIQAPREVTQYYECAAWHQTILVQPGVYDAYAFVEGGRLREISVTVDGVVVSADFTPLFGGNPIGPDRRGPERLGTMATGHVAIATFWRGGVSDAPPGLAYDARALSIVTWQPSSGGAMSQLEWRPDVAVRIMKPALHAGGMSMAEVRSF